MRKHRKFIEFLFNSINPECWLILLWSLSCKFTIISNPWVIHQPHSMTLTWRGVTFTRTICWEMWMSTLEAAIISKDPILWIVVDDWLASLSRRSASLLILQRRPTSLSYLPATPPTTIRCKQVQFDIVALDHIPLQKCFVMLPRISNLLQVWCGKHLTSRLEM